MGSVKVQQQATDIGFINYCGTVPKRNRSYAVGDSIAGGGGSGGGLGDVCGNFQPAASILSVNTAAQKVLELDLKRKAAQLQPNAKSARLSGDSTRNFGTLGGDGEESYARNSSAQREAVRSVMPVLTEAVDRIAIPVNKSGGQHLVIADLGCASGPNCLKNVDDIVCKLRARHVSQGLPAPSFQVFYQDLPSTDFNNLFRLVSEENGFHQIDHKEPAKLPSPLKYFAAGVPGTVYGRLFPDSSVNVIFSSYCLHWLSKVPDSIMTKGNPAFNKGRSWVSRASPAVAAAYKEQAARDLQTFLSARAAEVVPGGLALLLFVGRQNPDPSKVLDDGGGMLALLWDLVDDVFAELVSQEVISEETRDSFNCATYFRSLDEVREVVERFDSEWEIVRVEPHPIYHFAEYLAKSSSKETESPYGFARRVLLMYKVTRAPQIREHLGPEVSETFWQIYEKLYFGRKGLLEELYSRIGSPSIPATQLLVSLIRK